MTFGKRRAAALPALAVSGVLGLLRKAPVRKPSALLLGLASVAAALVLTAGPAPLAQAATTCPTGGGTFGIAPGSSSRSGGVSNLWLQANPSGLVTVEPGNGSAGQQWCELSEDVAGVYGFDLATYGNFGYGTEWYCLDDFGNASPGQRVGIQPCSWESNGDTVFNIEWKLCLRSPYYSFSLMPAWLSSGAVWLDVWGGPGPSAFKAGNPAQLWTGNGADNQIYSAYVSGTGHGTPRSLDVQSC